MMPLSCLKLHSNSASVIEMDNSHLNHLKLIEKYLYIPDFISDGSQLICSALF